jgi:SPP1 gp7 family putative phage head morphogenesis protein
MARDPLRLALDLPFAEAIAWALARRVELPETYYGTLQASARSRAFTVSGLAALDQIQRVLDHLQRATESGESFASWKKSALADLDELTMLPPGRMETIFRTGVQTHYNVGRWQQIERNADVLPFLMYDAINDSRVRPDHLGMDGHVAPVDDPIWRTWMPPNGFNCRCGVIPLDEDQARDRGWMPGPKAVPFNPDAGWDYNPAKGQDEALARVVKRRKALVPKAIADAARI